MGGVVSTTSTLKLGHDAWFPALSIAEHATVVEPRANAAPEGGEQVAVRIPELSTAAKVHVDVAIGALPLKGVIIRGDATE